MVINRDADDDDVSLAKTRAIIKEIADRPVQEGRDVHEARAGTTATHLPTVCRPGTWRGPCNGVGGGTYLVKEDMVEFQGRIDAEAVIPLEPG